MNPVRAGNPGRGLAALLMMSALVACGGGGGSTSNAPQAACSQAQVDGTIPPLTSSYIYPRQMVAPFYQWESNSGYCGEVTMIEAGLNNGQWMSQFNARLVCGSGLSQSGPDGACAAHDNQVDYNSQLSIESPDTGVTGPNPYADAAQCLANSRLSAATFDYASQTTGMAGYRQYLAWIKQQLISGHHVTIGVLVRGDSDQQYDHEVTVAKIGTNHSPADPTYYPDDVLYIEDHGLFTLSHGKFTDNPAIPPGAGSDTAGCTPYTYGYSFDSWAKTRAGANQKNAHAYSIVIPSDDTINTYTGGSGYDPLSITGPHNYAFSVAGPLDSDSETMPVVLTIVGPTYTDGKANPIGPLAGYNYENPMIGTSNHGDSCTNSPPSSWMTNFTLQATVSGLTPGVAYNLYEYDFSSISGVGSAAALAVPIGQFNANAGLATRVTTFTATASTFTTAVTTTSDKIVVFRCVPVGAP